MNCEDALVLISGHLDHANSAEEEAQLREHLEQCAACRNILDAFREADAGLMELCESAPDDLCESVMQVVCAEVDRKKLRRWRELAVAACLIVAIGVGASSLPGRDSAEVQVAEASVAADMVVYETKTVQPMLRMAAVEQTDPQQLAEEREADIAVTQELLPEMETCTCETLESGVLLYCLDTSDGAVQLSRTYGLALYQPSNGDAANVSYVLLLP